jgi:hypothetical protein
VKSFCSSFGSKLLAATICCGIAIIISGEIYYDSLPHFRGLPHVGIGSQDVYRVKPYIAAAIELQKMGQVKAEQHMMKYAKNITWTAIRFIFFAECFIQRGKLIGLRNLL